MNRPLAALAAALLLAACRDAPPAKPARLDRYTVRAEIGRLPARAGQEITIRHEAVPEFKDRDGAVVGMEPMLMGFSVGKDLRIDDLSVGDKVLVTFTVDFSRPALTVEKLERLPPDTLLEFGRAAPKR